MVIGKDKGYAPLVESAMPGSSGAQFLPPRPVASGKKEAQMASAEGGTSPLVLAISYAVLFSAIAALSTMGAITLLLNKNHSVPTLNVWSFRAQVGAIGLLPAAVYQLVHMPPEQKAAVFNAKTLVLWFFCAVAYTAWNGAFCVAILYTSLPHALLFIDAHCLILVAAKVVTCRQVFPLEIVGAVVGFSGGVLTLVGKALEKGWGDVLIGDGIAMGGSVMAAIYITYSKDFRKQIPLVVYLWPVIIMTIVVWTTAAALFDGGSLFGVDDKGGLGWLQLDILPYALFLGIVTLMYGLTSYTSVLKYLHAVVVSVAFLTNPIMGTLCGVALGVSDVPSPVDIVGGFIMLFGTFLVSFATRPSKIKALETERGDGDLHSPLLARGFSSTSTAHSINNAYSSLPEV